MRMPEAVPHPARERREARLDPAQKLRRGRGSAAVMADFEHVGRERGTEPLDEFPLLLAFGIAREQKAPLAVADPEHQRVIVCVPPWREVRTGREHIDAHSTKVTWAPAQFPR